MKTEMQSVKSSEEEEDVVSERLMKMVEMVKIDSEEEELMEPGPDDTDNDEVYRRSCCERCEHVHQSCGSKRIIPEKLSRGRYEARLEAEGTYECESTGLILEASGPVVVGYSVLPWSKVQKPWMIAGPTFNVETVPKDGSALKSIQLPHSLCLAGLVEKETVFGVLHITSEDAVIEPAESSGSHVKWCVSSLSPGTPIIRNTTPLEYHGAVLIYKDLSCDDDDDDLLTLQIYVVPNNSPAHVENIRKALLSCSAKRFGKVEKNPCTSLPLLEDASYCLTSKHAGVEIIPGELGLMFTLVELINPGYYTVEVEHEGHEKMRFQLQLQDKAEKATWHTNIGKGDLEKCTEVQPSPRSMCGLVSCTEERPSKRTLCGAVSEQRPEEGPPSKRHCLPQERGDADIVTEKQLMQVAGQIGKAWKQIGISLGITEVEMQRIELDHPQEHVERVYQMLFLWRRHQRTNATAAHLHTSLTGLDKYLVPDEIDFLLEERSHVPNWPEAHVVRCPSTSTASSTPHWGESSTPHWGESPTPHWGESSTPHRGEFRKENKGRATEHLRTNKTDLQAILMAGILHVIQCVFQHEAKLLVDFEYLWLKNISERDPVKAATELVDTMMSKGEPSCQAFLSLLRDPKLTDMLPALKTMPWYDHPARV